MKKIAIITMVSIPAAIAFGNDFVQFISKQENKYEVGTPSEEIPPPVTPPPNTGELDLSFQTWKDVSMHDLSKYRPYVQDESSKRESFYKFNMTAESFVGNPAGFTPYDQNYDINNLVNVASIENGAVKPANVEQVYYDKTYSSGKYYFEVVAIGQANADAIGMTSSTDKVAPDATQLGVDYAGNYSNQLRWQSGTTRDAYKMFGYQEPGTVYQVWVDYDNERMSIMEKDSTSLDYKDFDFVSEEEPEMADIPWGHIYHTVDLNSLVPAVADGSSDYSAKFFVNLGQEPFLGDPRGFTPYDVNHDINKWVNPYEILEDKYLVAHNNNRVYYNKKYSSGKYYFEVTIKEHTTLPNHDAVGFLDLDSISYYNMIGALLTGTHNNGYNLGLGRGYHAKYKTTGKSPSDTTFQVYIDYDRRLIGVMQLGSNKSEYEQYYNVFSK